MRCFVKKSALKNFANFNRKTAVLESLFKETSTLAFSCEICKIFKNTNFEELMQTAASSVPTFSILFN